MADCALCGHPRDDHFLGRCISWDWDADETCGCPYEPPEDEEND